MSLVSDALKKAQHEAAVREAKAKGLPERLVSASQPYRSRQLRSGRALSFTLAAVALLAVGSLVVYLLARPPAGPESAKASDAAPPAVAGGGAPATTQEAPENASVDSATAPQASESASPIGPAEAEPRTAATRSASVAAAEDSVSPSVKRQRSDIENVPSDSTPASTPAAPKAQWAARTFVREAILDDGVEIRLGGIAWSETAPLAYLNGRLLGVGESVSGFRVERIDRDRVRLAGAGGAIVLSLR